MKNIIVINVKIIFEGTMVIDSKRTILKQNERLRDSKTKRNILQVEC